jgi:hypothetical protein
MTRKFQTYVQASTAKLLYHRRTADYADHAGSVPLHLLVIPSEVLSFRAKPKKPRCCWQICGRFHFIAAVLKERRNPQFTHRYFTVWRWLALAIAYCALPSFASIRRLIPQSSRCYSCRGNRRELRSWLEQNADRFARKWRNSQKSFDFALRMTATGACSR